MCKAFRRRFFITGFLSGLTIAVGAVMLVNMGVKDDIAACVKMKSSTPMTVYKNQNRRLTF